MARAVAERWKSCPLRGCRATELAQGKLFIELQRASMLTQSKLALQLSPELSQEKRNECCTAFLVAKTHLELYLTLKLSHWQSPPWTVYLLASHDATEARAALAELLQHADEHICLQDLVKDWA